MKVPSAGPRVLPFSKSGFTDALQAEAQSNPKITLVDPDELVRGLTR